MRKLWDTPAGQPAVLTLSQMPVCPDTGRSSPGCALRGNVLTPPPLPPVAAASADLHLSPGPATCLLCDPGQSLHLAGPQCPRLFTRRRAGPGRVTRLCGALVHTQRIVASCSEPWTHPAALTLLCSEGSASAVAQFLGQLQCACLLSDHKPLKGRNHGVLAIATRPSGTASAQGAFAANPRAS